MTMTGPVMALMLSAALFPQVHGSMGAQEAGEVDIITADADTDARMTVPVRIGEKGPFRFLIDTGSQNTVVATSLAHELALKPDGRSLVISVAGSQMADTVVLDEIGLGRRSYYDLTAPLLERSDIGADGIIGLDGLQGQRVLLDFKRNIIAVDEPRKLGGNQGFEIVVSARKRSNQLIMTDAVIDGVRVSVIIDTGAEGTIGNRALQKALSKRSVVAKAELTSVTGHTITADISMGRQMRLGSMNITNLPLAFTDTPAFAALELEKRPAILLGMRELRMFSRVAIDFTSRKVFFDAPWEG
ncbi:MAG: retroviral-like aspartic protease family protein [Novosphingobium sp.]